jgi:hypothetical protein
MYGQLKTLCDYAGLDATLEYSLRIQHGLVNPSILVKNYGRRLRSRIGQLTWSQNVSERTGQNVYPIGSAFLYLDSVPTSTLETEVEHVLLVVPHGGTFNSGGPTGQNLEDRHLKVLKYLSQHSECRTVLLYWHDFLTTKTREMYYSSGVEVKCVGFPGLPNPNMINNNVGDQYKFLDNTRDLLLKSDKVVLFEPSTIALYAASLGKSIEFDRLGFEYQLQLEVKKLPLSRRSSYLDNAYYQSQIMFELSMMRKISRKGLALEILGGKYQLSRSDLRGLLGKYYLRKMNS